MCTSKNLIAVRQGGPAHSCLRFDMWAYLIGSVPGMDGHVLRGEQTNAIVASACVSSTMSPGPSQSLPLKVWYSPSQWPADSDADSPRCQPRK